MKLSYSSSDSSQNVLSKVCQSDKYKVSSNLEQDAADEKNIALGIVPESYTTPSERLEDFLPKALMLLIKIFWLTDPNIGHRWVLWIALYLGSPTDWPFWLIKVAIGLKPDLPEFWWIGQVSRTIWGFIAVDFYETMSKYLSHDIFALLGDHIDVCRFRQPIKRIVYLGMFCSLVLGLLIILLLVFIWEWIPLVDRITLPLRLIWWETSWLMIYCVFPGGIWAICKLLKSNICDVINAAMEFVGDVEDEDLQNIQKSISESNMRLTKFSQTFQRPLVSLITFYVYTLLWYPLNEFIWTIFYAITIIQIIFLLCSLDMLAGVVAKFARTIDERCKENDEFLSFQNTVDAVKLCGVRITQKKIWGFFCVSVVLLTILKIVGI